MKSMMGMSRAEIMANMDHKKTIAIFNHHEIWRCGGVYSPIEFAPQLRIQYKKVTVSTFEPGSVWSDGWDKDWKTAGPFISLWAKEKGDKVHLKDFKIYQHFMRIYNRDFLPNMP